MGFMMIYKLYEKDLTTGRYSVQKICPPKNRFLNNLFLNKISDLAEKLIKFMIVNEELETLPMQNIANTLKFIFGYSKNISGLNGKFEYIFLDLYIVPKLAIMGIMGDRQNG